MKPKTPNTISDRIKYLLSEEGINTYEFCKLENMLDQWKSFDYAINKGSRNNVNVSFIKKVFDRYRNKVSILWLLYGDDDKTIQAYLDKIKELEKEKLIVAEIINKSYGDIKAIVNKKNKE